jgi:hypothetical protein
MPGSQQSMVKKGQQEMGKGELLRGYDLYSCLRIYQLPENYLSKEDSI